MIRNLGAIIVDTIREEFLYDVFKKIGKKKTILDLGCGKKPFYKIYKSYTLKSFGLETVISPHLNNNIDVFGNAMYLPFKSSEFDIVLSTEVMEHIEEPSKLLREINRVLKKDGYLILTIPFAAPLHEVPIDYYRYTSYGLNYLCEKESFKIIILTPFSEFTGVLISMIINYELLFWNFISKVVKTKYFSSLFNPFVFFLIYTPQIVYLALFKIMSKKKIFKRIINKMSYYPKGYGLLAQKIEK